ncbi:MAG: ATP-binding protein [Acidobacteriota bacterium]|nr:ATP-binding protein [Acidobacteriota bacterium]
MAIEGAGPIDLDKFKAFVKRQAEKAEEKPEGTCPHCHGVGYFRVKKDGYEYVKPCACRREKILADALAKAKIPPIFRNTTLEEKPADDREGFRPFGGKKRDKVAIASQKKAVALLQDLRDTYLDVFLHGKQVDDLYGLMLYGECGRGKTRLACSLLCDLIYSGLTDVAFVEYNELFKMIRFSIGSREIDYKSVLDRLVHAKVLVIDDFGMEVSDNLVWVLDNIGYVINERYAANLPTIMTSNYWRPIRSDNEEDRDTKETNPYELHHSYELAKVHEETEREAKRIQEDDAYWDRLSYRLRSRISEMCFEIKLEGYDYRKKLGRNRELRREIEVEKNQGKG